LRARQLAFQANPGTFDSLGQNLGNGKGGLDKDTEVPDGREPTVEGETLA
jgi:hypothetical protein